MKLDIAPLNADKLPAPEIVLTNANDIELETALQQLALDLGCDAVETNVAARVHGLLGSVSVLHGGHCCKNDNGCREGFVEPWK